MMEITEMDIGNLDLLSYTYKGVTVKGIPSIVQSERKLERSLVTDAVARKTIALINECRELNIQEVNFSEKIDYSNVEMRRVYFGYA